MGLVLGFSSLGVGLSNGEGVDAWISDWVVGVDSGTPLKVDEFVLIIVTIGVDKSKIIVFCCLELNFVKFNFNFSLRQMKSG